MGIGTPNFQIHQHGLQRSPSMSRASHEQQQQQQYGLGAGNMNAARVYRQVSFGSGHQHNQQDPQMGQIRNKYEFCPVKLDRSNGSSYYVA
ncbi:hypothetical protein HanRHA438_Chr14g0679501 [Helianthus annuus]|nr:hypothetical protein HanRHA438_Chr14g0679501 [Helianthus annuus]